MKHTMADDESGVPEKIRKERILFHMHKEWGIREAVCDKCKNYIGLTDVEGHYSSVCKECKEKGDTTEKFDGRVNRRYTSSSPPMGEYS